MPDPAPGPPGGSAARLPRRRLLQQDGRGPRAQGRPPGRMTPKPAPARDQSKMTTTAERMRAWTGPAILTFGFRPFFLGAALWAALAMVLWLAMLAGRLDLPAAFDPVSWHAHEFLFGYLGAVMAGFLFTAVPNWTGRLPIVGWPRSEEHTSELQSRE